MRRPARPGLVLAYAALLHITGGQPHFIHTFQWNRIIPHLAKVRGWQITPNHFLNCQLDTVWLSE